jgi:hypothetical protein
MSMLLTNSQLLMTVVGSGGFGSCAGQVIASFVKSRYDSYNSQKQIKVDEEESHRDHQLDVRKQEFAETMQLIDTLRAQLTTQMSLSQQYFTDNQVLSRIVREKSSDYEKLDDNNHLSCQKIRDSEDKIRDLYKQLGRSLAFDKPRESSEKAGEVL